jgi:hypothetical protein
MRMRIGGVVVAGLACSFAGLTAPPVFVPRAHAAGPLHARRHPAKPRRSHGWVACAWADGKE